MGEVSSVSPFAPAALVGLPPIDGVAFATAEAGIRYKGRTDLLLAVLDEGTSVAGVLTQSKTASAPVLICRKHPKKGSWADWSLRRASARRRHERSKARQAAESAAEASVTLPASD